MQNRKLKLIVKMRGFEVPLGEVRIQKLAYMKKVRTKRVCPCCGQEPVWNGGYKCSCGAEYNHWSKLVETTEDGIEFKKVKLENGGIASVSMMSKAEFSKYVDVCLSEYGIVAMDAMSAKNLKNAILASEKLGMVIILNYNETYEKMTCVLTTNTSGRIILREIIPANLVENVAETMRVDEEVSEEAVEEAKQFMKLLPLATEENLITDDYRTLGVDKKVESGQVIALEKILAKVGFN